MIKAIIVDDEVSGVETLRILLEENCSDVSIVHTANSIIDGEIALRKLKPDLLFLDIEMPLGNGFTLLEKVKDMDFEVIFVTAYANHALNAIKEGAIDYLLKPIQISELIKAVDNVKKQVLLKKQGSANWHLIYNDLQNTFSAKKIGIKTADGIIYLDIDSIIRLEGDLNYTHIFLNNKQKYTSSKTLQEYEEILASKNFFRIHKAHLINIAFVHKYIKGEGGYVVMADNTTLEVSRRRKNELLDRLS